MSQAGPLPRGPSWPLPTVRLPAVWPPPWIQASRPRPPYRMTDDDGIWRRRDFPAGPVEMAAQPSACPSVRSPARPSARPPADDAAASVDRSTQTGVMCGTCGTVLSVPEGTHYRCRCRRNFRCFRCFCAESMTAANRSAFPDADPRPIADTVDSASGAEESSTGTESGASTPRPFSARQLTSRNHTEVDEPTQPPGPDRRPRLRL